MEQLKVDRINELARFSKERALTPIEQDEREKLRAEYLAEWKKNTVETLENTYIEDEFGNKTKLKRKDDKG